MKISYVKCFHWSTYINMNKGQNIIITFTFFLIESLILFLINKIYMSQLISSQKNIWIYKYGVWKYVSHLYFLKYNANVIQLVWFNPFRISIIGWRFEIKDIKFITHLYTSIGNIIKIKYQYLFFIINEKSNFFKLKISFMLIACT